MKNYIILQCQRMKSNLDCEKAANMDLLVVMFFCKILDNLDLGHN